jgi:hypothetical protein
MQRLVIRFAVLLVAAMAVCGLSGSCGGDQPSSTTETLPAAGGTVSLGEAVTLHIPPGAISDAAEVTIAEANDNDPAPAELEATIPVGQAFKIDIGEQELSKQVTLEVAFDPDLLPEGTPEEAVFLAYFDEASQAWVPVGGQVDQERNVIIVQTEHLSWWNPFTWNWEAWIAVMKKGFSLELSDWLEGFHLLTEECEKSGRNVTVDESRANNVVQGCIDVDEPSNFHLRVVNLKSFFVHVYPAADGPRYFGPVLLGPGEAVPFTATTSDPPPATVYIDFSQKAMWRFIVGLCSRMLPAGELIPDEGLEYIAEGLDEVLSAKEITEELESGDSLGAAEGLHKLITNDTFIETFAKLAAEYGRENGVDMMTKWTEVSVSQAFKGIAAVDVIISAWDFILNYFVNNRSQVAFTWVRHEVSGIPQPFATPRNGFMGQPPAGDDPKEVALAFVRACQTGDKEAARPLWIPTERPAFESKFELCSAVLAGCTQTGISQVLWDAGTYSGTGEVFIIFESDCVDYGYHYQADVMTDAAELWMHQIEGRWYVWENAFASY